MKWLRYVAIYDAKKPQVNEKQRMAEEGVTLSLRKYIIIEYRTRETNTPQYLIYNSSDERQ